MKTIEVLGAVGPAEARQLKAVLLELCAAPQPKVIVDLHGVDSLHLTGVNSLIAASVRAQRSAGSLTITAPAEGPVRRALELTALEHVLER